MKVPMAVGLPSMVFCIIQGPLALAPEYLFSEVQWGCFPRPLKKFTGRNRLRVLFMLFFLPKTVNWQLFCKSGRFKGSARDALRVPYRKKAMWKSK